jgi:hypothetical protein
MEKPTIAGKSIKFNFQPYNIDNNQASSGEILLYPDIHGIKSSDDIGILTKAEILPEGDWYTEYRLYDENDNVGQNKLETIETLWKQINGLPPYTKKRQKGFSIEGVIPDHAVMESEGGVIDDVTLDGVVLVPRPAYKDSIANACYKALNITSPQRTKSLQDAMRANINNEEEQNKYYTRKWEINDTLETLIEKIMTRNNNNKKQELDIIFDEYKEMMVNLILSSQAVFTSDDYLDELIDGSANTDDSVEESDNPKLELYKTLYLNVVHLQKIMEGKNAKAN